MVSNNQFQYLGGYAMLLDIRNQIESKNIDDKTSMTIESILPISKICIYSYEFWVVSPQ